LFLLSHLFSLSFLSIATSRLVLIYQKYVSLPDPPSDSLLTSFASNKDGGGMWPIEIGKSAKSAEENSDHVIRQPATGEDTISFPLPYRLPVLVKNNDPWKWDVDHLQEDILGEQWMPSVTG
jgi:hypothetical protein